MKARLLNRPHTSVSIHPNPKPNIVWMKVHCINISIMNIHMYWYVSHITNHVRIVHVHVDHHNHKLTSTILATCFLSVSTSSWGILPEAQSANLANLLSFLVGLLLLSPTGGSLIWLEKTESGNKHIIIIISKQKSSN